MTDFKTGHLKGATSFDLQENTFSLSMKKHFQIFKFTFFKGCIRNFTQLSLVSATLISFSPDMPAPIRHIVRVILKFEMWINNHRKSSYRINVYSATFASDM